MDQEHYEKSPLSDLYRHSSSVQNLSEKKMQAYIDANLKKKHYW